MENLIERYNKIKQDTITIKANKISVVNEDCIKKAEIITNGKYYIETQNKPQTIVAIDKKNGITCIFRGVFIFKNNMLNNCNHLILSFNEYSIKNM